MLLKRVISGTAVILQDKAAVWVDGRYTVAAKEQLDSHWTPIFEGIYVQYNIVLLTKCCDISATRVRASKSSVWRRNIPSVKACSRTRDATQAQSQTQEQGHSQAMQVMQPKQAKLVLGLRLRLRHLQSHSRPQSPCFTVSAGRQTCAEEKSSCASFCACVCDFSVDTLLGFETSGQC